MLSVFFGERNREEKERGEEGERERERKAIDNTQLGLCNSFLVGRIRGNKLKAKRKN